MANVIPYDVQLSLNKQVPKLLRREIEKQIDSRFNEIKSKLIQEFLQHPITQEILAGPSSSNSSGTLGGVSNLFAFIGFEESDEPINPILEILNSITISYSGDIAKGCKFRSNFPEPSDIFEITPMPWASGRSWSEGIEKGISGLGYLLSTYDKSFSRSGAAMQSSVKVRGGGFRNTPYISFILNKYQKELNKLNKR
jgi:hypothetical protein